MTRGHRVFALALGVIAVAVAWRAFIAPAAGTSAGEHVISGGVPIAVAAALVITYARIPVWARAWVWLVCGALAVSAGAAGALRATVAGSPSAADLVGLAGLGAGVALVAGGLAQVWTGRRRGGSRVRRYAHRAGVGVAVLLGGFLLVFPAAFAIVATHRAPVAVEAADLGRPYETVTLRSSDGLRLEGWYVPSRNRAAVIVFPGRSGPVAHARMLAEHGYGVLMLDRRGEGQSEGTYNAFGWDGVRDVHAAVAFLRSRPDVDPQRVGGLGLSVGGEMLLQAAAENPGLRAVVSEGAGVRSLREHLDDPSVGKVQRWLSNWVAQHAALSVFADAPVPPSLTDVVGRIAPRPILLIRGGEGNPDEVLNEAYLAAAGEPKALWTIPEAGHTDGLAARPQEYERRVVGFFDAALR